MSRLSGATVLYVNQVLAAVVKGLTLRLRDVIPTTLQLAAPSMFILLLSFGWWYSTTPVNMPAMYNSSYLLNMSASGGTAPTDSLGDVFCQVTSSSRTFLPSCPNSSVLADEGGFCLSFVPAADDPVVSDVCVLNASLAGSLSFTFQDPLTPAIVPSLDAFLLYSAFTTATAASTKFMSRCAEASLSHAGYLVIAGSASGVASTFRQYCLSQSFLCSLVLYPTTFSSAEAAASFAHDNGGLVWAVLDLTRLALDPSPAVGMPRLEYSIRMNYTATPWTFDTAKPFSQGLGAQDYLLYLSSGFLSLQAFVDRFIITQVLNNVSNASSSSLVDHFFSDNVSRFIGADHIAMEPFPTRAFYANTFLTSWSYFLPLILMLSSLVSLGVLLNGIVEEKASRLREAMFIMGFRPPCLYLSWYLLALLLDLVSSIGSSLVLRFSFFSNVEYMLLLLLNLSFMQTISALGMLISVFFSHPKVAAVVGPLVVFVSSVPFYAIPHGTTKASLMWLSLLPSTAYAEAVNIMTTYATFGYDVHLREIGTASASASNGGGPPYTIATSIGMMWASVLVYLLLAAYLEAVIPHEFGQRRHPLFFVQALISFIRRCSIRHQTLLRDDGEEEADNSTAPALELEALSKTYHGSSFSLSSIKQQLCGHEEEHEGGGGGEGSSEMKPALRNVSTTLDKGNINVLIGANGAGKTTMINMIVGMIPATSGAVRVCGFDSNADRVAARKRIGYCPQYDILWPTLSVEEHLMFFARLRSKEWDVRREVEKALHIVRLDAKRHAQSAGLSAGQRRRLCVAIALVCDPPLVLLDEPTAMMDIRCRRDLYDALTKHRSSRCVLMSTHQLDEAETVGDQMLFLKGGELAASGPCEQLRHELTASYVLTVLLSNSSSTGANEGDGLMSIAEKKLRELVTSVVTRPCEVLSVTSRGREVEFRLSPSIFTATTLTSSDAQKERDVIGCELFAKLEAQQAALGIKAFGLGTSSLEDVFMAIESKPHNNLDGSNRMTNNEQSEKASIVTESLPLLQNRHSINDGSDATPSVVVGAKAGESAETVDASSRSSSFGPHFRAMCAKRLACARRDRRALCFHIVLPVIFLAFALLLQLIKPPDQPPLQLDASMYAASSQLPVEVLLSQWEGRGGLLFSNYTNLAASLNGPATGQQLYAAGADEILCPATDGGIGCDVPLDDILLQQLLSHRLPRTTALSFSGEYGDGTGLASMILHNVSYPHSIAEGMSLIHNVVLRELLRMADVGDRGWKEGIRTINHPLPMSQHEDQLVGLFRRVIGGIFILIPFLFIPSSFVAFIVQEKESGARHLQYMAGANVLAFWLASALFDLGAYIVTEALAFAVFFSFNRVEYIGDVDLALATASLLFIYGLSSIPFTYAVSFGFRTHGTAQNVVLCVNFLVGFLLVIAEQVLSGYTSTLNPSLDAGHFLRAIPAYALGEGMFTIAGRRLSLIMAPPGSPPQPSVFSFLVFSNTNGGFTGGIGTSLLYMGLMFVTSCLVLFLLELWTFLRRYDKLVALPADSQEKNEEEEVEDKTKEKDPSVVAEEEHVYLLRTNSCSSSTLFPSPPSISELEGIVLDSVTRRFPPNDTVVAVDKVSFLVKRGETLALLGLNGSGKSTIVGMLAGQLNPSSGRAFVGGLNVLDPRCRGHVGYCPQSDALLPLVTCREHLVLYCRLRGIKESNLIQDVASLLADLGLNEFADVPAGELSFGNRRKLSVAIALAGDTKVVLLDEPTAGMDPIARRRTCEAIRRRCAAARQALLLTTHQLDEVDALADRVAIISNGSLRCIGERQELKTRFTKGSYTVHFTFQQPSPTTGVLEKAVLRALEQESRAHGKEKESGSWDIKMVGDRLCAATAQQLPLSTICRAAAAVHRRFSSVEPHKREEEAMLAIAHWSVSQHSIEQVLLRLSS